MKNQIDFEKFTAIINIVLLIEEIEKAVKLLYRKVNNSYISSVDTLRLTVSRVILGLNDASMIYLLNSNKLYFILNRYKWDDQIKK